MVMRNIKLYLMFACCCAVLLSGGCAKWDTPPDEPDKTPGKLGFDVSSLLTRNSRVSDVNDILSMGVFAYNTGTDDYNASNPAHIPNTLYNQRVTRASSGTPWEYSPLAYWPYDLNLKNSFFAYSPHSSDFPIEANARVSASTAFGNPTLTYTMPSVIADQQDILYAMPMLNKNSSSVGVNDGKVGYTMQRAMSAIAFIVTALNDEDPEAEFDVTWFAFLADRMPLTATLDLGYIPPTGVPFRDNAWSAPTQFGGVNYEFELDDNPLTGATGIKSGELRDVTGRNNVLLLFPITIDSETSNATVDLTFDFDGYEYYYWTPLPTVYMHAGYVTVFVITLSVEGIFVEFKEINTIDEWLEGDSIEVEMY
jgi:hypothetical protein